MKKIFFLLIFWSYSWTTYCQADKVTINKNNNGINHKVNGNDFMVRGMNNMNEEWFGICAKGITNSRGLYQLFSRTSDYTLKETHHFNPYADATNSAALNNYFKSIEPVDPISKAGNNETTYNVNSKEITAKEILGNSKYQAICYGGFRAKTRKVEPTLAEITEDLKILSAMNIKVLRTYNVHNMEVSDLLKAIRALKTRDANFEMYVMLGAWIDCKNAFTALPPIHTEESEHNAVEIEEAVKLTNEYPDIIKIIAVGNEAMVKWAASYYVQPVTILKWVNHLQNLKKEQKLPANVWITCSDNFASWGGGGDEYHVEELNQLIKAVDYISMHTYPMHDTHYNPKFWGISDSEKNLSEREKINAAMIRARDYSILQYKSVSIYMKSLGVEKPIHIGETGWATMSNERYGNAGSKATDEYKSALYYKLMREWTNREGISLFYFEAFDEQWKDSANALGSENHFGLINLQSQAKYALWEMVDQGVFKGLTRDGKPITKTYNGNVETLWLDVQTPAAFIKN